MSAQPNLRDLWYDWLGINTWLFKEINKLSDIPVYTHVVSFMSNFGDSDLLPYYLGIITGYAIITSIANHGSGKHTLLVWFNILVVMVGALFVNSYTNDYLKSSTAYPRPYVILPRAEVIQLEALPAEKAYQSFPSGHAALITIIIAGLWPIMTEAFRWVGIAAIFGVCWSRIALGVHFPMDVISGFTIALLQVVIIRAILFKTYAMINSLMHLLSRAR